MRRQTKSRARVITLPPIPPRRDEEDGYYWIMGGADDSGEPRSPATALVSHPKVAEAACVGRPDEIKGEAIAAIVTVKSGVQVSDELKQELRLHVRKEIGAHAQPDDIRFSDALPKTRSGKIMRGLLRDLAAGRQTGDTTTLEDLTVLAKLREEDE